MCFQGSPRSWGMAPQRSAHQAYFQGLSSQVRAVCRLHLPSLANTFPGQRGTARGEGGFRNVSAPQRAAMLGSPSRGHLAPPMGVPCWGHPAEGTWHLPWTCHAGVTQLRAPGTSHGPLAKSGRQSPGLQKTEAESTASSDRRKQTATGGLCRQLMGRPALGLPRLKMPVGAPRPQL